MPSRSTFPPPNLHSSPYTCPPPETLVTKDINISAFRVGFRGYREILLDLHHKARVSERNLAAAYAMSVTGIA
eukprot:1986090-Rhodomonas_salina.1